MESASLYFIIIAVLYWRRHRKQTNSMCAGYREKPELPGTEGEKGVNFVLKEKPLGGANQPWRQQTADCEMEVEHHELWQQTNELGSDERALSLPQTEDTEADGGRPRIVSVVPASKTASKKLPSSSPSSPLCPFLAGPLPSSSDLYPSGHTSRKIAERDGTRIPRVKNTGKTSYDSRARTISTREGTARHGGRRIETTESFACWNRELQEKSAMIAEPKILALEKAQLTMEEESLRRRKVFPAGMRSGS